jgi:hypothetical protein
MYDKDIKIPRANLFVHVSPCIGFRLPCVAPYHLQVTEYYDILWTRDGRYVSVRVSLNCSSAITRENYQKLDPHDCRTHGYYSPSTGAEQAGRQVPYR